MSRATTSGRRVRHVEVGVGADAGRSTGDGVGAAGGSADPVRVRIAESGQPDGRPTVVALHGIGRSLADWQPQHDRLGATRHMISIDLPGFGHSDRMPGPMSLPVLADGVLATLDALGETAPVHLLGNSLGGAVALRLQSTDPARVVSSTLVAGAGFGREVTIALRLLAVPGLGRLLLRPSPNGTRRGELALFVDPSHVTEERVAHALELAGRPGVAAAVLETALGLGTLRGVSPGWRTELLDAVARHPRPTLLLWGDGDLVLPARQLRAARVALPHAQSHVFARTGHMPQIERADRFAELVGAFLDRHDRTG